MRRVFWVMLLALLFPGVLVAELAVGDPGEYRGVVLEKPWAKEMDSYCQGGSEYYVLKTEQGQELALNSGRDDISENQFIEWQEKLKQLAGKKVLLKAHPVMLSLTEEEHCPPGSQCPVGAISCAFLRVLDVNEQP